MQTSPSITLARNPTPAFYGAWVLVALGLYFTLMLGLDCSLFAPRPGRIVEDPDGFEQTIVAFLFDADERPLWLMARFALVAPLLAMNEMARVSLLQAVYLLAYSLPVALWAPPGAARRVPQLLLLMMPVFISFRLAISIYGVCYCLMFALDRRISPWSFLWFALTVFLSSSTMFIFLLYFPALLLRRLRGCGRVIQLMLWLLYAMVASQFFDKLLGLFTRSLSGEVLSTASAAGLDYSGSTSGFFMTMLTGNPFFTAIVSEQYDRLLLLVPSFLIAAFLLIQLIQRGDRRVVNFVLILLASMLSEGVGSYSVGVVLFIVLIHRQVFFMKHRRRRRRHAVPGDDSSPPSQAPLLLLPAPSSP